MIYTSLNEIKSLEPCSDGWRAVLKGQNKMTADDVKFPLAEAVESNSISDICWYLGKIGDKTRLAKFARLCADSVKDLGTTRYARYADAAAADAGAADAVYAADAAAAAAVHAADAASDNTAQTAKNKQFMLQVISEVRRIDSE